MNSISSINEDFESFIQEDDVAKNFNLKLDLKEKSHSNHVTKNNFFKISNKFRNGIQKIQRSKLIKIPGMKEEVKIPTKLKPLPLLKKCRDQNLMNRLFQSPKPISRNNFSINNSPHNHSSFNRDLFGTKKLGMVIKKTKCKRRNKILEKFMPKNCDSIDEVTSRNHNESIRQVRRKPRMKESGTVLIESTTFSDEKKPVDRKSRFCKNVMKGSSRNFSSNTRNNHLNSRNFTTHTRKLHKRPRECVTNTDLQDLTFKSPLRVYNSPGKYCSPKVKVSPRNMFSPKSITDSKAHLRSLCYGTKPINSSPSKVKTIPVTLEHQRTITENIRQLNLRKKINSPNGNSEVDCLLRSFVEKNKQLEEKRSKKLSNSELKDLIKKRKKSILNKYLGL